VGYTFGTIVRSNITMMDSAILRKQLLKQIHDAEAHISLNQALQDIPFSKLGVRIDPLEHTLWTLTYHIRICQDDIISYVEDSDYKELPFPSGYWPKNDAPGDISQWDMELKALESGLKKMETWIENEDLFAPLKANADHNLYRQITIIAHHNSYHLAQILDLRQLLEIPVKDW